MIQACTTMSVTGNIACVFVWLAFEWLIHLFIKMLALHDSGKQEDNFAVDLTW